MKAKHFYFIPIACFILFFSTCKDCPECPDCSSNTDFIKKEKTIAKTEEINGVCIFLKSEPIQDHTSLGTVKNNINEKIKENSKGKKIGQVVKGLFKTIANDTDFNKLLIDMVAQAKEAYPDVEAVVFKDNLSSCEAIKFK